MKKIKNEQKELSIMQASMQFVNPVLAGMFCSG